MANFTALYLPMTRRENPTRSGFQTEDEAWKYVLTKICADCKKEGLDSACALEWDVISTKEYVECNESMTIYKIPEKKK